MKDSFKLEEDQDKITVKSNNMCLIFNKILGKIENWEVESNNLIIPGTNSLTFWRPLTDTDRKKDSSYWTRFGLDTLTTAVRSISTKLDSNNVIIETELYIAPPILGWGFMTKVIYTITGMSVKICTHISPTSLADKGIPAFLPRIGWEFAVSSSLTKSKWFGLGPGESYSDKQDGVSVGMFETETKFFDYNYDVPQETGNRDRTRYFWIGSSKKGLIGKMSSKGKEHLFGFKTSVASNLEVARHPHEIIDGSMILRIDYAQHGLGSSVCRTRVLPAYVLETEEVEFTVDLIAS